MSGVQFIAIALAGDDLVVLDATRRVYAGRSRDGASYHLIQPARADDPRVTNDPPVRREGELVCTCAGGTFRGTCYRVAQAEGFESGLAGQSVPWMDAPAGAGDAVEAWRG